MKYSSINQLHNFEFHDSEWTLDSLTKDTLVVFNSGNLKITNFGHLNFTKNGDFLNVIFGYLF